MNNVNWLEKYNYLELLYFPLLSRSIKLTENSTTDTTKVNLMYTIARSIAHPINYPGNPHKKKKIACGLSWVARGYLLQALGIKDQTLHKLLDKGVKLGFWRRYSEAGGFIQFSLRNPLKIANRLGLAEVGNLCNVTVSDFSKIHVYNTEMIALSWQSRSHHAAKVAKENKNKTVHSPGHIVFSKKKTQCRQAPGKPRTLSSRYVGLDDRSASYGVSLNTVARLTGKSISTVTNHLNNKWRADNGVPELPKRQLCKLTNLSSEQVLFAQQHKEDINGYSPDQFFVAGKDVYLKSNCVYFDQQGWNSKVPRNLMQKAREDSNTTPGGSDKLDPILNNEEEDQIVEVEPSNNQQDQRPTLKDQNGNLFLDLYDVYHQPPTPPTPPADSGDGDGNRLIPLAEKIRYWEKVKGIKPQTHEFEKLKPNAQLKFLKSNYAYPFINKAGKVITPPLQDVEYDIRDEDVYIHILDYAAAVSEAFRSKKSKKVSRKNNQSNPKKQANKKLDS